MLLAAKAPGKRFKPRYCLTSLSEGTRKTLCQNPTDGQKRRQRRCGAFEARVVPNVASEGTRKARKGPTDGQKRRQGPCGAFEARVVPNVAF